MTTNSYSHLKHEALVGGVSNTVFNGLIAWWMLAGGAALGWGGSNSFVIDIFATAFLLPFIVAVIVMPMQKKKLAKGALSPINLGADSVLQSLVNRLPQSTFANACCFGLAGMALVAPLPLIGFYLAGVEQIPPLNYAVFKGLWAGAMAAVLVIPMVMSALRPVPQT